MSTKTKKKKSKKKTTARTVGARKKKSKTTGKKVGKKTAKKVGKKGAARKTPPPSMPKGSPLMGHEINGISVVTADGRAPSKKGAQGYVEGSRIKKVKFIQALRSDGVGDVSSLTKSVRVDGIIEPLVVRPAGDGKNFELIAGERRHTAAKTVGGKVWDNIPVIIRMDIQGDDDRAIAVAVAENSPDGRTNLNIIDIGRQAVRLRKKGWSSDRIAKEFGLGIKTVSRSLQFMEMPDAIQSKVRSGKLSMIAGLELNRLPAKRQKELASKVGPETTAADIRRERKKLEASDDKKKASAGKSTEKRTIKGKPKTKVTTAWRSPSDKKAQIGQMCASFSESEDDDIGTTDWHEIRGSIAYALWDRGDLESPILPDYDSGDADDRKVNALFTSVVGNEAGRFAAK